MKRNRRQLGEGQAGCIIGLIFLIASVFVAYKMIPIKVKTAELRQAIQDEGKSAGLPRHNDAYIMKAILTKAKDLELPVTEKEVEITRTSNNIIRIRVKYVTPVEFPGYVYMWNHEHFAENPIF